MNEITITTKIPATLVAISAEMTAEISRIVADAKAVSQIENASEFSAADTVLANATKVLRAIDEERKKTKAPILDLGRALDEAAGEAMAPLLGVKSSLGGMILRYQREENARREEARRIAEKMRAEEDAKRLAEAAAAAASATTEACPWDDELPMALPPAPIDYERHAELAPMKSSAVVEKTVKEVVIINPELVPKELAGAQLWAIDEKAVRKLALAGVSIPGVEVRISKIIATKGR